ncbi:MAG: tyrosine-type recombinase/integrase [Terracidiphilus sp.]
MLSVYTRHHPDCKNAGDKTWRRCSCPKWIWGSLNGKFMRQSAKTPRWEEAEELRRQLSEGQPPASHPAAKTDLDVNASVPRREGSGSDRPQRPRVTVEKAVEAYLADATSRGVAAATHTKLTTIFRKQFLPWTQSQGLAYLDEIDLDALLNFRSTWSDAALAKQKKQSRVIGFFWACVRRRYLQENPALGLGKIKVVQIPTDYFPPEEFDRIIDATYRVCDNRGGFIDTDSNRARLRTMTLLMRWSGLRIRDAITLERHRLHGDSLLLYQAKTGTPVYVPLPPFVVEALENLPAGPKPNLRYFFWSGNGDPKSAVANWQRSYRRLFKLTDIRTPDGEIKRCHPHMFRDTFAVEMLLAGVPIDQVSLLLGHASVKITEKSYSPFVKARQVQLQESVRNAWKLGQPTGNGPGTSPPGSAASHKRSAGWQVIQTRKKTGTG